jgi:hypothetical protein
MSGEEITVREEYASNGRHANDPVFSDSIDLRVFRDGNELFGSRKEEILSIIS